MSEAADMFEALPPLESKGAAAPLVRTTAQQKALEKQQRIQAEAARKQQIADGYKATGVRLAQLVNLTISGYSFEDIAAATGHTPAEIEAMLDNDANRYIRTQPALRTYVRNYISAKYSELIDIDWPIATDPAHKDFSEVQANVVKILDKLSKLHGAPAPVQHDVTVDAAPDAVEAMVARLAASRGRGYDASVFDTVPGQLVEQTHRDLEVSGNAVEQEQPGDDRL